MEARSRIQGVPRIGVSWVKVYDESSERHRQAVRCAGGEPVDLMAEAASWDDVLATVDGLLLTGGGDVDPSLYGEPNLRSRGVAVDRDRLERHALGYCRQRGLPVLAICRGLQFVNVYFGGSLIQDIGSPIQHRAVKGVSGFHGISIVPGTRLAGIAGGRLEMCVNSRHHQGVDASRVAPGLRLSAKSDDGIVEGLEAIDCPFLVAVQCHPERVDEVPELSGLFAALVEQARWSIR